MACRRQTVRYLGDTTPFHAVRFRHPALSPRPGRGFERNSPYLGGLALSSRPDTSIHSIRSPPVAAKPSSSANRIVALTLSLSFVRREDPAFSIQVRFLYQFKSPRPRPSPHPCFSLSLPFRLLQFISPASPECSFSRPSFIMLTVEKQWINVQQKTFTKWSVFHLLFRANGPPLVRPGGLRPPQPVAVAASFVVRPQSLTFSGLIG